MAQLDPNRYTIAWIAPLSIEKRAARHMLDKEHHGLFPDDNGDYSYLAGEMCGHNVIIATFPAGSIYGRAAAAALASHIKTNFRNIRFGLLVGIAAGLPLLSSSPPRDIRLGDVLVAMPDNKSAGVVAYDLGKDTDSGFENLRNGWSIASTTGRIGSAIGDIRDEAPNDAELFVKYYEKMKNKEHSDGDFCDPGQDRDHLYDSDEELVVRKPREDRRRTRVWYGPIGSGERLMKNSRARNKLRDEWKIFGLEMEAAGVMNSIQMGVIRGVSDYGDAHKNDEWQPYAAAMAAAYAKAILQRIPVQQTAPGRAVPGRATPREAGSMNADDGEDDTDNAVNRGGTNYAYGNNNKLVAGNFHGGTFTM